MKKGQANILVVILIVILVLVGIGIISSIIISMIKNSSDKININQFSFGGNVKYVVSGDGNLLKVSFQRTSGEGNISGIRFAVDMNDGTRYTYDNMTFIPLIFEIKDYIIKKSDLSPLTPESFNYNNMSKISVYFYVFDSKNNKNILLENIIASSKSPAFEKKACSDACSVGSCENSKYSSCIDSNGDGCKELVNPIICNNGCDADGCKATSQCFGECSGDTCSGNGILPCILDSNGCKKLSLVINCLSGLICNSGQCVIFSDPCNRNCSDNDPCTIDSCSNGNCSHNTISCGSGETCRNGNCVKIISNCNQQIDSPGDYLVSNDISSDGTCLTINSDNVILNGNGKKISFNNLQESGTAGILIKGDRTNLVIKNFNSPGGIFDNGAGYDVNGIDVDTGLANSTILNNTINILAANSNWGSNGIYFNISNLAYSFNNTLKDNNISSSNFYAIEFVNSSYNNLINNNINASYGILYSNPSSYDVFVNNTIIAPGIGIGFSSYSLDKVINNTIISNSPVTSSVSFNNSIINNKLISLNSGVYSYNSSFDTLINNYINTGTFSFYAYYCNNDSLINNQIFSSGYDGIYLGPSYGNNFSYNTINSDVSFGIDFTDSSGYNTISFNNISSTLSTIYSLKEVNNTVISNNNIISKSYAGIYLNLGSNYNNFSYNNITTNSYGIDIVGVSIGDLINNNNIFSNISGTVSMYSSLNDNILSNNLTSSSWNSIYYSYLSDHSNISYNNLYSNRSTIYMNYISRGDIISNNNISSSALNGIYLTASSDDLILNNNISSISGANDLVLPATSTNLQLFNQTIRTYNILTSTSIIFENNFGILDFYMNGVGQGILGSGTNLIGDSNSDVKISQNSVYFGNQGGFNQPSNVILYNTGVNSGAKVYKDGVLCGSSCTGPVNIGGTSYSFTIPEPGTYFIGN